MKLMLCLGMRLEWGVYVSFPDLLVFVPPKSVISIDQINVGVESVGLTPQTVGGCWKPGRLADSQFIIPFIHP